MRVRSLMGEKNRGLAARRAFEAEQRHAHERARARRATQFEIAEPAFDLT